MTRAEQLAWIALTGRLAGELGRRAADNPHPRGSLEQAVWNVARNCAAHETVSREMCDPRGRAWTDPEIALAQRLQRDGSLTLRQIANIVGHSHAAVRTKLSRVRHAT